MNPATATRAEIREFVRKKNQELVDFSKAGGNPHQKSLDQKDLLEEQLAPLTDEQRDRFYRIYAEELNANNEQMLSDAQKADRQAAMIEAGDGGFGRVILLGFVVVVVIAMAGKLAS
ncbi:hypothetical protein [Pseudomonas sp.]|uniref:hypothetical protein n=1 Tax=Pseudomonas sp. TaxID=306 RepID=UPI0025851219|nr:hypothetical protein [Pseudomonas sp.]